MTVKDRKIVKDRQSGQRRIREVEEADGERAVVPAWPNHGPSAWTLLILTPVVQHEMYDPVCVSERDDESVCAYWA